MARASSGFQSSRIHKIGRCCTLAAMSAWIFRPHVTRALPQKCSLW